MRLRYPIIAALCALSTYFGICMEAGHIQATCDAPYAHTWINGVDYLCVSAEAVERAKSRTQGERGA